MPAGDRKCDWTFLGWLVGFVAALITHLDNQQLRLRLRFDTEFHFYIAKETQQIPYRRVKAETYFYHI